MVHALDVGSPGFPFSVCERGAFQRNPTKVHRRTRLTPGLRSRNMDAWSTRPKSWRVVGVSDELAGRGCRLSQEWGVVRPAISVRLLWSGLLLAPLALICSALPPN